MQLFCECISERTNWGLKMIITVYAIQNCLPFFPICIVSLQVNNLEKVSFVQLFIKKLSYTTELPCINILFRSCNDPESGKIVNKKKETLKKRWKKTMWQELMLWKLAKINFPFDKLYVHNTDKVEKIQE